MEGTDRLILIGYQLHILESQFFISTSFYYTILATRITSKSIKWPDQIIVIQLIFLCFNSFVNLITFQAGSTMHDNPPHMSKWIYWPNKRKHVHRGKFCYSCISCYVVYAIVLQGALLLWWHLYPSECFASRIHLLLLNITSQYDH